MTYFHIFEMASTKSNDFIKDTIASLQLNKFLNRKEKYYKITLKSVSIDDSKF